MSQHVAVVLIVLALSIPPAIADGFQDKDDVEPPAALMIDGDVEYGEYLSSECTACHQASGVSDGIPSINDWPPEAFVMAMYDYKYRIRPHPVMQMIAARLGDEEIAALAAYFAALDNETAPKPED